MKLNEFLTLPESASEAIIEPLLAGFLTTYSRQPRGIQRAKLQANLSVLLANFLKCYEYDGTEVAVSHDSGHYSVTRYSNSDLSYRTSVKLIEYLLGQHYIELVRNFSHDRTGRNRSHRRTYKAAESLIQRFVETGITTTELEAIQGVETVILKDSSKRLVEYEDTSVTTTMRNNLDTINAFITEHRVGLFLPDNELLSHNTDEGSPSNPDPKVIDFTETKLYRTFNNSSFEQGGRFYGGWWQNVPNRRKKWRQFITIDQQITCEVDFKAIQLAMVYALEGVDYTPAYNHYELDGLFTETVNSDKKYRPHIKRAFTIMVNCDTKAKAISALRSELGGLPTLPTGWTAERIVESFTAQHPQIAQYFCSGKGLMLQYKDSLIAEQVLLSLASQGIVALPIHDSFIVKLEHKEALIEAMRVAYESVMEQRAPRKTEEERPSISTSLQPVIIYPTEVTLSEYSLYYSLHN